MKRLALVTLLALSACGNRKGPVVMPGQVVVAGDVTYHTQTGNTIEVRVMRKWQGHEATGVARLRGMTLEAAQKSPLVGVAGARAWLTILGQLTGEPTAAYDGAKHAIEELGTDYRYRKRDGKYVIDDTGNRLKLAAMSAEKGDIASAAHDAQKVLEERVELYLRMFEGSVE